MGITSYIWPPTDKPWYPFLSRLAASGRPIDEMVGEILGVSVGASTNHAHATINVIDFYLADERKAEREHIIELVRQGDGKRDKDADELLLGYVNEAMRTCASVHILGLG